MRKIWISLAIIAASALLAACGSGNKPEIQGGMPKILEVDLSVKPEKALPNQPVMFEAKVTQGNEEVKDADAVLFEIWRANDEQHEKIEVKHAEHGIYRLEKSFSLEGTYYIISHVTARDMHNMPRKEFTVGNPSEPEAPKTNQSMDDMEKSDGK